MAGGAYIKFVFRATRYKWEGQSPDDFGDEFAKVYVQTVDARAKRFEIEGFPNDIDGDERASMVDILTEMGATISEIRSLRTDGTIRCQDLRLYVVY